MLSAITAACAAMFIGSTTTDDPVVAPRAWEHAASDVAPDPEIRFGALKNGLRYAWRKNGEPKERAYLWMHVDVGSLGEDESERGMAHFLEHMAFNGSDNFKPGTLIQWLQERGLDFGADSNAHTGFSETVYTLNLPSSDEKSLREGMLVLSDMAGRLTLSQEEIDAEKGVIDGEERERDSAQARLSIKTLEEYFAGTRVADRIPIGTKAARDAFSAESVRKFFSKWYRPDNITVILVGDLEELDPLPLIEEAFGALPTPASARSPEPPPGAPKFEQPFYSRFEPEVPSVTVNLGRYEPFVERAYTQATAVEDLPLRVACAMLNRRFAEHAKAGAAPYLQGVAGWSRSRGITQGPTLSVACEPAKWKEAFAAAELELRAAIEFGFQDEELRVQRADRLRALDEAVRREPTRSSASIASEISSAAEDRLVPATATTMREIIKPAVEALTVESCQAALAAAWKRGVEGMQCLGNVDLGESAADQLKAVLAESRKAKPQRPDAVAAAKFAYASDPEKKGTIAARTTLVESVTDLTFENGVRALLKPTEFKQREVRFSASIGEGELSSPAKDSAVRAVAGEAFNAAGLEAHDEDAIRRQLAGRSVSVGFGVGDAAFMLGGTAATDDLLLGFELAAAYAAHGGWRDDGLKRLARAVPQQYEQLGHSLSGPFALRLEREIYGGDPRFGAPSQEQILAVDMAAVKSWIAPQLANGPITIAVVGDFDLETAIDGLARTFGRLEKRRARSVDASALVPPKFLPGKRLTDSVVTEDKGGLVIALFPADDGIDPQRRRDFHFLSRILRDRLINVVREKLGVSYSPTAYEDLSLSIPKLGRFIIRAESEPSGVDALAAALVDVAASIAEDGVTDEEVARLKEPLLKDLRDQRRQNRFWHSALERMHSDPGALDAALAAEAYYHALDAKHLGEVAKKCFDRKSASVAIVTPKGAPEPGDERESGKPQPKDPAKGER